jgi:hypothetical protein
MNTEKGIVEYLKFQVDEGNAEYEKIQKEIADVNSNLGSLE